LEGIKIKDLENLSRLEHAPGVPFHEVENDMDIDEVYIFMKSVFSSTLKILKLPKCETV
jgi:hypothetical protein